jgi:hypothetical protein
MAQVREESAAINQKISHVMKPGALDSLILFALFQLTSVKLCSLASPSRTGLN